MNKTVLFALSAALLTTSCVKNDNNGKAKQEVKKETTTQTKTISGMATPAIEKVYEAACVNPVLTINGPLTYKLVSPVEVEEYVNNDAPEYEEQDNEEVVIEDEVEVETVLQTIEMTLEAKESEAQSRIVDGIQIVDGNITGLPQLNYNSRFSLNDGDSVSININTIDEEGEVTNTVELTKEINLANAEFVNVDLEKLSNEDKLLTRFLVPSLEKTRVATLELSNDDQIVTIEVREECGKFTQETARKLETKLAEKMARIKAIKEQNKAEINELKAEAQTQISELKNQANEFKSNLSKLVDSEIKLQKEEERLAKEAAEKERLAKIQAEEDAKLAAYERALEAEALKEMEKEEKARLEKENKERIAKEKADKEKADRLAYLRNFKEIPVKSMKMWYMRKFDLDAYDQYKIDRAESQKIKAQDKAIALENDRKRKIEIQRKKAEIQAQVEKRRIEIAKKKAEILARKEAQRKENLRLAEEARVKEEKRIEQEKRDQIAEKLMASFMSKLDKKVSSIQKDLNEKVNTIQEESASLETDADAIAEDIETEETLEQETSND